MVNISLLATAATQLMISLITKLDPFITKPKPY